MAWAFARARHHDAGLYQLLARRSGEVGRLELLALGLRALKGVFQGLRSGPGVL